LSWPKFNTCKGVLVNLDRDFEEDNLLFREFEILYDTVCILKKIQKNFKFY